VLVGGSMRKAAAAALVVIADAASGMLLRAAQKLAIAAGPACATGLTRSRSMGPAGASSGLPTL
jgi:hypothetical protein